MPKCGPHFCPLCADKPNPQLRCKQALCTRSVLHAADALHAFDASRIQRLGPTPVGIDRLVHANAQVEGKRHGLVAMLVVSECMRVALAGEASVHMALGVTLAASAQLQHGDRILGGYG